MLVNAWKEGGLQLEKQVRASIREKTVEKNNKIYAEMEERNQVVEEKRSRVLAKYTHKESQLLGQLQQERASEDYELLNEDGKILLNLRIEELTRYLELMKEGVKYLDL
jgi:hypothetical protein